MQNKQKENAWFKAAMEFGKKNNSWFAVQVGSQQDRDWKAYFTKMGWTPYAVAIATEKYTMPIELPTWLPAGFPKTVPGAAPAAKAKKVIPPEWRRGKRANLLVRGDRPRYEEMVKRATAPGADIEEFQWHPDGIKVSRLWWTGEPGLAAMLPAEVRQLLKKPSA